jgi:transposase InsO family protein
MPWKEVTCMSQKLEFVYYAMTEDSNITELCQRFEISRKTGYKWINRYRTGGASALIDRYRKPHFSPHKTDPTMERAILQTRQIHRSWGGRKIRKRLLDQGWPAVPSASTITAILKRNQCIDPTESLKHKAWQRFEAQSPNELWQMDFKGHFAADQGRCHPLTVLDDHSRYALGLQACSDEKASTVRQQLISIFRRYGLPRQMLMDNGSPWGADQQHVFTGLTVWLIRQGIGIIHSRPFHPQTLGKDERFHRTFKAEIGQYCIGLSLEKCQQRFDSWRDVYNFQRPHESLDMQVPARRYQPSRQQYSEKPAPIEYAPADQVRKVQQRGWISYKGKAYRLPKAFCGQRVAIRPTATDALFDVYYCNQKIVQLNVKEHSNIKNVLPMSPNTCNP